MNISDLKSGAESLLGAFLLATVTFFIAKSKGYFRLPDIDKKNPVKWYYTAAVFLLYIKLGLLILPLIPLLFLHITKKGSLTKEEIGWLQILFLLVVFVCVRLYTSYISKDVTKFIFWGSQKADLNRFMKSVFMGFLSCIISYPFVLLANAISTTLVVKIWGEISIEQVAVKQLRLLKGYPLLFTILGILVVFCVPYIEELIFRGFLQSTLKRYFGRIVAVVSTALIFSLFHYAVSQKISNIPLICSLFVLSLFLGFVYERERSLWAPIALHSLFNSVNLITILVAS